jgi:hypothetical protein
MRGIAPGITQVGQSDVFGDFFIPKFGGDIWYCDVGAAASGDGRSPYTPFQTIAEAIAAASAGDKIKVKAGTYDEAGLDLNLAGLQLELEAGVILQDSADGTVLTISAFGCKVTGIGNVRLDPTGGATGVLASGNFASITNLRINANSVGALGFDLTGDGAEVIDCRCADPTVAAFKIQGDKIKLDRCCTGGNATTIGYWITNSCDKYRLITCGSQGHGAAGFQVDTGCTNGVIWEFSSGGGDGKWTDADNETVISNLAYEQEVFSAVTFTATGGVGGVGTNYNLFKVTGAVRVFNLWGHVETATPATNSTVNLELYSTNASIDITDAAGAPDLVSRCAGTVLARESVATDPLEIGEPDNTPAVIENTSFNDPRVPVILCEDDAADTYIQLVLSAALASGAMHWHCQWQPVTEDGFLELA